MVGVRPEWEVSCDLHSPRVTQVHLPGFGTLRIGDSVVQV